MIELFTLGHSTHPVLRVIELLQQHGVTAVCDVRSQPYSRRNPQFSREAFGQTLSEAGIAYVFLGKELGGRPEDPACYVDGRVDYERVALICAEKDPADCHRALLVGRAARGRGWVVNHILADGGLATQNEVVGGLLG